MLARIGDTKKRQGRSARWMPQRRSLIFLAVLLTLLLPFLLQMAWPFLTSFILAVVLCIVMNPVKEWIERRIHRPGLASFVTTFGTVFAVGIVLAFAGFTITQELTDAYDALSRRSLEEGGWPALVTHTTGSSMRWPPACPSTRTPSAPN
jgi:predicted PurR-regulated permease PerM